MFWLASVCLFVSKITENTGLIFTKLVERWHVGHGRNHSGGNLDHITLGFG